MSAGCWGSKLVDRWVGNLAVLAVDNSVEMKVGMKVVRLVKKVVGDWAPALVDW
jgi:hypothetical protein